jgi:hypothetical protein
MRFLVALGHTIEIKIGARSDKRGEVVVRDARGRAA